MFAATVSSKFQIAIPKKIREQLLIKPGQQFIFIPKGNCIELVRKRGIQDIKGVLAGANVDDTRDRNDRG